MEFILVQEGKVANIILADQSFIDSIASEYDHIEPRSEALSSVVIGWNWSVANGYVAPPITQPEMPPVPVEKKITQLAFISRFTDAEAIALDLASIGATVEAASIRRYMQKVNAATFIDLDREDTISGVNQLEAVGLIGAGRANVILTAPITDQEIPR